MQNNIKFNIKLFAINNKVNTNINSIHFINYEMYTQSI